MLPSSDAFPGTSNEVRGEKNIWGQPLADLRQASKLIPWQRKLPISILHSVAVIEPHPFLQSWLRTNRGAGIAATDAKLYPIYAPDYWATCFTDPDGIR